MRVGFVVLGLLLVTSATVLEAVARHDGILGVTPPEAFPAPGQTAEGVRTRVVVDGTPGTTQAYLTEMEGRGLLTAAAASGAYTYVTAHFDQPGAVAIILLRVSEPPPPIGTALVVEGVARTQMAPPGLSSGAPLLWLEAQAVQEPILFKND